MIAGAGLAGACAALVLSRDRRVLVLDATEPASGASGAAAGIVNPFMGRKAKPAWRTDEALGALDSLLDESGASSLFRRTGVLRPAGDARQRAAFEARAAEHAGALGWLPPEAAAERWPDVAAPHGALFVTRGGHLDLPAFVRALLGAAEARGAVVLRGQRLTGWRRGAEGVVAITDQREVRCPQLLLALGDGARHLPTLDALPLHPVKGQTLRLKRPDGLSADLPAVAGHGYVAPAAASVVVGATFDHTFVSADPDPLRDAELREKAARLVPALADAEVLDRRAGIRVTVPTLVSPGRLPLAGPLPGHPPVWLLTGLGSKGLLTAPLLARFLPAALDGRQRLPPEVDTRAVLGLG